MTIERKDTMSDKTTTKTENTTEAKATTKAAAKTAGVRGPSAHVVQVRLTKEESERYRVAATELGLTLSSMLRVATNTYLRNQGL
jgi:hypothetical protein